MKFYVKFILFTLISVNEINCHGIIGDFLHNNFPHLPTSLFGFGNDPKGINGNTDEDEFNFVSKLNNSFSFD